MNKLGMALLIISLVYVSGLIVVWIDAHHKITALENAPNPPKGQVAVSAEYGNPWLSWLGFLFKGNTTNKDSNGVRDVVN